MSENSAYEIGRITRGSPSVGGITSFEASGDDRRAALEAALQATLAVAGIEPVQSLTGDDVRSAPIRGEGDDLASLIADMIEDLLGQIEYFGSGLHDVAIDGLMRRDRGGYVAWGYASGTPRTASGLEPLRLHGSPTVNEDDSGHIVIQASFIRDGAA